MTLNILKYFLVFCYIFNIAFIFLPAALTTRILIGFVGLFYLIIQQSLFIKKKTLIIIFSILVIFIPSILTSLVNDYFDPRFFGFVFQNLLYLAGAYFIITYLRISTINLFYIIVICIFIHNLLSLIMFLNPSLQSTIIQMQWLQKNEVINVVADFQSRFIGIGWGNFFFGGVICSVALLLNAYLITIGKKTILLGIIYIFIAITGMFIARITMLGIVLSFSFLLFVYSKKGLSNLFKIIFFLSILIVALFLYFQANSRFLLNNDAFLHAFELIINFFENDSLSTGSTDTVVGMMRFPTDNKGLIIGDGIFNLPNGVYYMETDVGFSRLMFYFGIFGTSLYFLCHLTIMKFVNKQQFKILNIFILVLLIISNFKGLVDLNWFMFLFYFSLSNKNHSRNESITNYR